MSFGANLEDLAGKLGLLARVAGIHGGASRAIARRIIAHRYWRADGRPCYPQSMTDAPIQQRADAKPRARPAPKAAAPKARWQVWRDAAGRLSALRIVTLACLLRAGRDRGL